LVKNMGLYMRIDMVKRLKTTLATFRVDVELWRQFKQAARKRRCTASELLREFLRREVARG
jgi:predicted DNA-binding ribbon-helix-helix protein